MKIILLIAAYLLIPIAAKVLLERCLSSYRTQDTRVSYPLYVLIIGIVCTVFFITLISIMAFGEQFSWLAALGFFLFVLLGASLIVAYCRCCIQFDETSFTVTGFFGKTRTYAYNDITGIQTDMNAYVLYCGERRVEVATIADGSKEFLTMAQTQYKRLHGGAGIPKVTRKKDLFNGHIRNPMEFIILYAVMFLLTLVMIVLMLVVVFRTYDETNTTLMECCFTDCTVEGQGLIFTSEQGDVYKLDSVGQDYSVSRLRALCDGQTPLKVYVREVTPEDGESYYGIEQIEDAKTVVLSFEESRAFWWQTDGRWITLLLAVVVVLCWAMIGFSILIGRNPRKYPRYVVRLFFKDRYVIDK